LADLSSLPESDQIETLQNLVSDFEVIIASCIGDVLVHAGDSSYRLLPSVAALSDFRALFGSAVRVIAFRVGNPQLPIGFALESACFTQEFTISSDWAGCSAR
jgi:hypothetical protein